MFLFGRRKKEEDKLYPGFISRMFASVIDILLATIAIIPVCTIIYSILYNGLPPSKRLSQILSKIYEYARTYEEIGPAIDNSVEYQNFISSYGLSAILLEQSIQLVLLGMIILGFWLKTQSTPGKMLLSMKIVTNDTMQKPTLFQYLLRLFGYVISVLPLGLGLFYILLNKRRRALHDVIAGTVVISTKSTNKK